MRIKDIEKWVLALPETDVSDEEVERREKEMESAAVVAIPHQEFVRRVQEVRRRSNGY